MLANELGQVHCKYKNRKKEKTIAVGKDETRHKQKQPTS
jgi:hypothetical protein